MASPWSNGQPRTCATHTQKAGEGGGRHTFSFSGIQHARMLLGAEPSRQRNIHTREQTHSHTRIQILVGFSSSSLFCSPALLCTCLLLALCARGRGCTKGASVFLRSSLKRALFGDLFQLPASVPPFSNTPPPLRYSSHACAGVARGFHNASASLEWNESAPPGCFSFTFLSFFPRLFSANKQ